MSESTNFFERYSNYIDDLKNRILQIQLRYMACQTQISSDFSKGFIAKEVAEKMLAVKIYQFAPSIDRGYRLSKADVDFIKEYADLDAEGNLLTTILKPEYLKKAELVERILNSVKTFAYYDKLDPTFRRITLTNEMTNSVKERISFFTAKIEENLQLHGEKFKKTESYHNIQREIERLTKLLESFKNIIDFDDERLINLISSFYKVDYDFYEWFNKMDLLSTEKDGTIYSEHRNNLYRLSSYNDSLIRNQKKLEELILKSNKLTNSLLSFLDNSIDFDMDSFEEEEQPEKISIFKRNKAPKNNKELLSKLFLRITSLSGATLYLKNTFCNSEQKIELASCFDIYFNEKYGQDIIYVDIDDFFFELRKTIIDYYKGNIQDIKKEIEAHIHLMSGNNIILTNGLETGYRQALLQERLHNSSNIDPNTLIIDGFTEEELNEMYISLKQILKDKYNFDLKTNKNDMPLSLKNK